jgi:Zn-finger nucleic acid-binding protein
VERLLKDERGLDFELLRELSEQIGDERLRCPGCGGTCSTIQVKGERVDLCFGCGGIWLDPGELGGLGEGRHAEAVALDGRAAEERVQRLRAAEEKAASIRRARDEENARRSAAKARAQRLRRAALLVIGVVGLGVMLFAAGQAERHRSVRCTRDDQARIYCDIEVARTLRTDRWREGPLRAVNAHISEHEDEGTTYYRVTIDVVGFPLQRGGWREQETATREVARVKAFNEGETRVYNASSTTGELMVWIIALFVSLVVLVTALGRTR